MNRENTKRERNEKGFTMIELIIVVAIMGIIGAVLVPTFNNMSTKARLTSDITTIKTLQRQLDIHKAETGDYPGTFATLDKGKITDESGVIDGLVTKGYLDAKDLNVNNDGKHTLKLQTGATLKAVGNRCYLSFDNTKAKDKEYIALIKSYEDTDDIKVWAKDGDNTISK